MNIVHGDTINCPVCAGTLERFEHFAFDCPAAKDLWTWAITVWSTASEQNMAKCGRMFLLGLVADPASNSSWRDPLHELGTAMPRFSNPTQLHRTDRPAADHPVSAHAPAQSPQRQPCTEGCSRVFAARSILSREDPVCQMFRFLRSFAPSLISSTRKCA